MTKILDFTHEMFINYFDQEYFSNIYYFKNKYEKFQVEAGDFEEEYKQFETDQRSDINLFLKNKSK